MWLQINLVLQATSAVTLLNGNTVPQKMTDFNESLNMMRVGEMYLIEAEAKARLNKADASELYCMHCK